MYTARLCGTYPVQAREGAIYNFPVVVETEHGRRGVHHAADRPADCRHIPGSCRAAVIAGENVAVATAEDGQTYTSPMTGLCYGGYTPRCGSAGVYLDGVLMTDTASGSAGFEATPAGWSPGHFFRRYDP